MVFAPTGSVSGEGKVANIRWLGRALLIMVGLGASIAASAEPPLFDTATETTYRQVTWEDFKGRPARRQLEQARISTAIQAVPLEIKVTLVDQGSWVAVPLAVEFYSAMSKVESSVGKGARTDQLLAHEQGHFDLTEIMPRRLNRRLVGLESQGASTKGARANLIKKIERAYDQAAEELSELQSSYDARTRHGIARQEQRQWSEKIAEMLAGAG